MRREVWNEARRAGDTSGARWLKGARWALWKRPERLTERQQAKLATIEHVNRPPLPRLPAQGAAAARLPRSRPRRGRRAARRLARLGAPLPDPELRQARQDDHRYQAGIVATLTHRLSNARIEAINTTLRLICRRAYGFHSADALIALAMLTLGGDRLPLPTSA